MSPIISVPSSKAVLRARLWAALNLAPSRPWSMTVSTTATMAMVTAASARVKPAAGRRGGSQGGPHRKSPSSGASRMNTSRWNLKVPVRAMISMVKKFPYAGCLRTTWWSEAAPRGSKRAKTGPAS